MASFYVALAVSNTLRHRLSLKMNQFFFIFPDGPITILVFISQRNGMCVLKWGGWVGFLSCTRVCRKHITYGPNVEIFYEDW